MGVGEDLRVDPVALQKPETSQGQDKDAGKQEADGKPVHRMNTLDPRPSRSFAAGKGDKSAHLLKHPPSPRLVPYWPIARRRSWRGHAFTAPVRSLRAGSTTF